MLYTSLLVALGVLVNIGYITNPNIKAISESVTIWAFYILFLIEVLRIYGVILVFRKLSLAVYSSLVILFFMLVVVIARNTHIGIVQYFARDEFLYLSVIVLFIMQLSKSSLLLDRLYFNPTIFFVISFLVLILIGTLLLTLPLTTVSAPLSFIDAIFMATSAVCITGLSVVDISSSLTMFGKSVILFLIQIGGLGIMTFTGFFGYFFSGGFSFKNQLMYGEILGEGKLNQVIQTLLTIIFITLLFESIGAVLIFFTMDGSIYSSFRERVFYSVFHSVSGFCNAGFSVAKEDSGIHAYRFNYAFQMVLASMFMLGTLGFGTIFNLFTYTKSKFGRFLSKINRRNFKYKAHYISFNTKFILICNLIVIVLATVSFFVLEYDNTLLQDKSLSGKIMSSIFMANSSRTAGFQSIGVAYVDLPTLIMISTLMWIGSSPGSTGGGVKVSTVAISILNIGALARGKSSLQFFGRRIDSESVNKAFAIIFLSFLSIMCCFALLSITSEEDIDRMALLFESISAYTTSGLSLGITPSLNVSNKIVLILTMFMGRVGMLTLLVAFVKNTKNQNYIYPTEKLLF